MDAGALCEALDAWLAGHQGEQTAPAQTFTVCGPSFSKEYSLNRAPRPLAVGTVETFLTDLCADGSCRVDYIHGEEAARSLAGENAAAILLPPFEKADLFRGVVLGGVLPRKTFSMGHAEEKRYYNECRALV